ncbi:MAG: serine/threonine-protein kinase [Microcoleaceae cyanobacterium MO_207.B10]|nr:serine/threonine-protein kinase [Microcoleaceae cyanobacterium MO_207.B10]
MSYCLNLHCQQPQNPNNVELCQCCGSKLLLRGHYQAVKPIANGNFGRIFLAVDLDRFSTPCVIKQFFPQNQTSLAIHKATEMFQREAEQLLRLGEHPQIPTLYAYFQQDHNLYLVEQLIEGQNLLQELEQQGEFSGQKIWEILLDLLPLLDYIHHNQVIHRDIKPENILRVKVKNSSEKAETEKTKLVLVDFGAAKLKNNIYLDKTGTITGTIGYSPIEQIRGGKAYPASDLYSLGMTCIHLLTKVAPNQLFDPFNGKLIWRSHLNQKNIIISHNLEAILDKLVKDLLKERYQSARELLTEILAIYPENSSPNIKLISAPETLQLKQQKANHKYPHIDIIVQGQIEAWKTQQSQVESPYNMSKKINNQSLFERQISDNKTEKNYLKNHSELGSNVIEFDKKKSQLCQVKPRIRNYIKLSKTWKTVQIMTAHTTPVNAMAIGPQGYILISGSDDKVIKLWNLKTGQMLHRFYGHTAEIYGIAVSRDGKRVITGGDDKTILAWNLTKKTIADRFYSYCGSPYSHRDGAILSVAISPNGKIVASASADHTIKLWNQRNGELLYRLDEHLDKVFCVTYSNANNISINVHNQIFASSSADGLIKIWRVGRCQSLRTLKGHYGGVYSVAFTPDGQTIVSGSNDTTVKLWNVRTGELLNTLKGHSRGVFSVAISPNGKILATASGDGTVKLWNLHTGKLLDSLCGYYPVQFSPDGQTLVSGGEKGRILIWKLSL